MNRGYTSAEYLELLDTARQIVPDIAVAGDFIVGFPGETDDDFAQTVELVKKARYKNSFIFKYSSRPGTIADKRLEDNVPQQIKEKRNHELLKVQEEISRILAAEFTGQTVKVLVEGPSKKSKAPNFMLRLPQGKLRATIDRPGPQATGLPFSTARKTSQAGSQTSKLSAQPRLPSSANWSDRTV